MPSRARAADGWAANWRQAAAMLVAPRARSSPRAVLRSAAITSGVLPQRTWGWVVEDGLDVGQELRLVVLDHHYVVAAALDDGLGDGALGQQGVHGEDAPLQHQAAQQRHRDGDLVRLIVDRLLAQGQPESV